MKSNHLLAGLMGVVGSMGQNMGPNLDRLTDDPTPRQPRPEGADERDMQAAEAKRKRRAEKARRDAELRDGGKR